MATHTYRSLEPASAARFDAILERHARESPLTTAARAIVARRVARIAGGAVAALAGATTLLVGLRGELLEDGWMFRCLRVLDASLRKVLLLPDVSPTALLLAAGPAALVTGGLAYVLARLRTAHALRPPAMPVPADALAELARLEDSPSLRTLQRLAARLEGWSAAAPLAALSLIAPLTLHWLVALAFASPHSRFDFDGWIRVSALFVGPAHAVLVFLGVRWALSLRRRDAGALRSGVHLQWVKALFVTAAVGAVPCFLVLLLDGGREIDSPWGAAILSLIPAAITFATGLLFVPAMYLVTARRIAQERLALG